MTTPIRVLIVEDVPDDAELLLLELQRGGYAPTCERIETAEQMRAALELHPWDVILSDYTLPQFSALAALTLANELAPDVPFVVVSGTIGEEVAVETMRAGASDYVLKRSLTRLGPAVRRELREADNRRERRRAEQAAYRLAAIVQSSDDAIIGKTLDGIITDWNPGAERLYGYAAAEVVGKHISVLVPPDREEESARIMARLKRGERIASLETVRLRKDGCPVHVSLTISPILDTAGRVIGASKTARDITEKRQADEALRQQTRLLESVLTSMGDGVIGADEQGNYLLFNPAAAAIVGVGKINCSPDEWAKRYGLYLSDGVTLYPTHRLPVLRAMRGEAVDDLEMLVRNETVPEGRWISVTARPLVDGIAGKQGSVAVFRDITERKKAEEQSARYAAIVRDSNDSIISKTLDGVISSWNPGAERLYGYTADEVIGKSMSFLIPPDHEEEFKEIMDRIGRGERVKSYETVRVRKDGSTVEVFVTISPIQNTAGRIIGVSSIARDITDRKRAEADLRASEERLRLAAEAARFGTFDHDFITGQTFRSAEFKAIFGVPLDAPFEIAADGLPAYIHRDDREAVREQTMAVLDPANSGVGEMQHRIVRANDGAIRWVLVRGRTTFTGEWMARRPTRFTGIVLDLTDRLQAEEALHLRDRAIQAVASGILITDPSQPDNPIIYASPGFERLTGYRQDEVLGKNCRLLQGKETDRRAVAEVRAAVQEGRSCDTELLNYRKDGTSFWNRLLISPVRDGAGRLTHFVGVQTDITERRSLQEQFRQAQKMEAVGRLAGGVAHDFNNLLTIINGYGDIVARSLPDGHPAKELVLQIAKAGERAASLTQQLLAFSRKTVLEPKVLDLNIQIREMVKLLRRLIGEDILLATSFDPDTGRVKADPGQLEQAIINLCVNARDAMPRGGTITIETRNVELAELDARDSVDLLPGSYVLLAVTDTGQGMDATTRARIFEPFFTTKEPGKGTGLGLAMVYGFIKQSMGHIAVQSEPGQGATFKLYLPRSDQAVSSGRSHPGLYVMPRGDETLLLVEDEPAVRALGRHVLQSCGYTVLEGGDGNEALRVARRHTGPVHLLLTDVVMPHLGGRQVAEQVLVLHPEAKVLFLSGYTDDAVVRHGVQEAHTNFLQKPFTPSCLAQKVREILDQQTALGAL